MKILENKEAHFKCGHCGYTSDEKFTGDICPNCGLTYWKCSHCGFLITAVKPPDICPECTGVCNFIDVTCYSPDCGGPGHIDPRLI